MCSSVIAGCSGGAYRPESWHDDTSVSCMFPAERRILSWVDRARKMILKHPSQRHLMEKTFVSTLTRAVLTRTALLLGNSPAGQTGGLAVASLRHWTPESTVRIHFGVPHATNP